MSRFRDDRSTRIVESLAMFVAVARGQSGPNASVVQRVAEELLFDAALTHYERQLDHMSVDRAQRWLRTRIEELVANFSSDEADEKRVA